MKTLQPIYGQSYVGYYSNALTEECEISGVCKSYHGAPVLVNEKGEWVPFEKLTEESYITPPFVEPRLRESVRRFLREEIDKEKFLDKLKSLSDEEQEDLMTSLLSTVEADAEGAEQNGEIVADEVATEIESWVSGEETGKETDKETEEETEPAEVSNTVKETVVSSLDESSTRFNEATLKDLVTLINNVYDPSQKTPQTSKGINLLLNMMKRFGSDMNKWYEHFGPLDMPEDARNRIIAYIEKKILPAIEETHPEVIPALSVLQKYVGAGPTPQESAAALAKDTKQVHKKGEVAAVTFPEEWWETRWEKRRQTLGGLGVALAS